MNRLAPIRHRTQGTQRARSRELAKRLLDVIVACIATVLLGPGLLIIALLVTITSPGPALFHQVRVGRDGREFRMWKFRTMDVNADDSIHRRYVTAVLTGQPDIAAGGARLKKLEDDPRVTRFGAFLRRWSLDELPQLFNALGGSMSLVGPRPVLPWEADLLESHHRLRFEVKPGITGLWQVCGRSAVSMLEALDLDVEYVARRSFALDVSILIRTIPTVLWERTAT
jgi:lipopolysaccharide/colanic/teichoic acid biosynthesis glycosyltransferase